MKKAILFLFGVLAGVLLSSATSSYRKAPQAPGGMIVRFSPKGGCTEAVVAAVGAARQEVLVQDYSFTSEPIAKALVAARKRGLSVRVIMDKSVLTQKSEIDMLHSAGVEVWIDSRHAIAHNKVMVIDGETVVTGSFNFTNQAETSNAENLVVLPPNSGAGPLYKSNWNDHLGHSTRFLGRASVPAPPKRR